jgi:hypothetical protein
MIFVKSFAAGMAALIGALLIFGGAFVGAFKKLSN